MIMVATFVISLEFYEFVIKRSAITRWLFGLKIANKNQEKKFRDRSFHT